jgi:hypothetical protein
MVRRVHGGRADGMPDIAPANAGWRTLVPNAQNGDEREKTDQRRAPCSDTAAE